MIEKKKKLFQKIWETGLIVFDTCCLGRMYEWEFREALNIKDALSYLYETDHIWETSINCDEFKDQRLAIKNSIRTKKYEEGIFSHLSKTPVPWNKIDGTLGRWEGKGYPREFHSELNKLKGKTRVSEEEIQGLREVADRLFFLPQSEHLFNAILSDNDLLLSQKEKQELRARYDSGAVCPGSGDSKKNNGRKYNDLFIWALMKKKGICRREGYTIRHFGHCKRRLVYRWGTA